LPRPPIAAILTTLIALRPGGRRIVKQLKQAYTVAGGFWASFTQALYRLFVQLVTK